MTSAAQASQDKPTETLPKLREELQIIAGRRNSETERTWRIYDPLQHRYIEIDETPSRFSRFGMTPKMAHH